MKDKVLLKQLSDMRKSKLTNMRKAHDASVRIGENYEPTDYDLGIIENLDRKIQKMTSHRGI